MREGGKLQESTPNGTDFVYQSQVSLLLEVSGVGKVEGLGPLQGLVKGADEAQTTGDEAEPKAQLSLDLKQ